MDQVRKCIYENCKILPSFAKTVSNKAEYCKNHAPETYISVVSKRCSYLNCNGILSPSLQTKEFCTTHLLN